MSAIQSNKIARRPFMAELLARRGGALIVCGLGSPTWDCFAAGDSPEYLYSWGGMGLAVPTALGVALTQPGKRVVCVTGLLFKAPGPVLAVAKIALTEEPWALPEKDGAAIATRFRGALGVR